MLRALRELESEEVAKAPRGEGRIRGLFGDAKREDIEEEAKATARMDDVNEAGVGRGEAETHPGFFARVGRAFGFGGRRTRWAAETTSRGGERDAAFIFICDV